MVGNKGASAGVATVNRRVTYHMTESFRSRVTSDAYLRKKRKEKI